VVSDDRNKLAEAIRLVVDLGALEVKAGERNGSLVDRKNVDKDRNNLNMHKGGQRFWRSDANCRRDIFLNRTYKTTASI